MQLDHTIVPAHDAAASARFFAAIFGLEYRGAEGSFAAVSLDNSLTFDFATTPSFEHHHYAFRLGKREFERALRRVQAADVSYGSNSKALDRQVALRSDGRAFYVRDPNGHIFEAVTSEE